MSQIQTFGAEARIFCERLGIERPVLNAPMFGVAGPELVAAVSEAGGLGVVPAAELSPEAIRSFVARVRELTDRPFAVNLRVPQEWPEETQKARDLFDAVSPLLESLGLSGVADDYDWTGKGLFPDFFAQFDAVIECAPTAVTASFGGFREPEAERLQAAGIFSIGTATTLREAKVLRAAEADALIVQGAEAGGPRLSFEDPDDALVGLGALLPAAVRATGLPVLASGGIADARQAAGYRAMGAAGAVLGTALVPVRESEASHAHRWFAANGGATDTVLTRLFSGRLERVLRTALWEALAEREALSAPWPQPLLWMRSIEEAARRDGREELLTPALGQSAGRSAFADAAEAVRVIGKAFEDGN